MKARAKDVLQTLKKEIPSNLLSDIERVLTDLYLIRDSESKTEEYYNSILRADYRYQIRDSKPSSILDKVEIDMSDAKDFRRHLLELVKNDPSFGYIFHQLGMDYNGYLSHLIKYDCVPKEPNILFHIKYTWEDLKETIYNLPDTEKLRTLIQKKGECQNSNFPIELKNEFIEKCETEICMIRELMALPDISQDSEPNIDNNLSNIASQEPVLFDKSIIDKLNQLTNKLFICKKPFLVFNKPNECEIEVNILPGEIKRTQYLLNKMYKHIRKKFPENHEIADEWLKSISNRFGLSVESIEKVGLSHYEKNNSFKKSLDNYFALIDSEL